MPRHRYDNDGTPVPSYNKRNRNRHRHSIDDYDDSRDRRLARHHYGRRRRDKDYRRSDSPERHLIKFDANHRGHGDERREYRHGALRNGETRRHSDRTPPYSRNTRHFDENWHASYHKRHHDDENDDFEFHQNSEHLKNRKRYYSERRSSPERYDVDSRVIRHHSFDRDHRNHQYDVTPSSSYSRRSPEIFANSLHYQSGRNGTNNFPPWSRYQNPGSSRPSSPRCPATNPPYQKTFPSESSYRHPDDYSNTPLLRSHSVSDSPMDERLRNNLYDSVYSTPSSSNVQYNNFENSMQEHRQSRETPSRKRRRDSRNERYKWNSQRFDFPSPLTTMGNSNAHPKVSPFIKTNKSQSFSSINYHSSTASESLFGHHLVNHSFRPSVEVASSRESRENVEMLDARFTNASAFRSPDYAEELDKLFQQSPPMPISSGLENSKECSNSPACQLSPITSSDYPDAYSPDLPAYDSDENVKSPDLPEYTYDFDDENITINNDLDYDTSLMATIANEVNPDAMNFALEANIMAQFEEKFEEIPSHSDIITNNVSPVSPEHPFDPMAPMTPVPNRFFGDEISSFSPISPRRVPMPAIDENIFLIDCLRFVDTIDDVLLDYSVVDKHPEDVYAGSIVNLSFDVLLSARDSDTFFDELLEISDIFGITIGCDARYAGIFHKNHVFGDGETSIESFTDKMNQWTFIERMQHHLIAIGPCGFDDNCASNDAARDIQKNVFNLQAKMAVKFKIPLIVTCRNSKSINQVVSALENTIDSKHPIYYTNFYGSLSEAKCLLTQFPNVHFGIQYTSMKMLHIRSIIKTLPLTALFIESGKRKKNTINEAYLVAEYIANLKKMPLNKVLQIMMDSAKKFYGLSI